MGRSLTIIVTAHDEGELAGYTIESLRRACKKSTDFRYDFLINIDKGDKKTKDFFKKFSDEAEINYTEFGDPGLARNAAIKLAKGDYVMLIDADDVVSENWIEEAMVVIESNKDKVLVHPEIELRYSRSGFDSMDMRIDLEDMKEDCLAMILGNRWCSVMIGKRKTVAKFLYPESRGGYGYEDYHYNCESLSRGVRHLVAKGTTVFCLLKEKSVTQRTHDENKILPYTGFFEIRKLKRLARKKISLKENIEMREMIKMPAFVQCQIKELQRFDKIFEKVGDQIENVRVDRDGVYESIKIGLDFCKMVMSLQAKKNNRLIFVNNLTEFTELYNKKDIFIAVDKCDNLPQKRNVLDFGRFFGGRPDWVKDAILDRLMVQLRVVEILTDDVFIRGWITKHKKFLKENMVRVSNML